MSSLPSTKSSSAWPTTAPWSRSHQRSETAAAYRFDDGVGEIGIIAPVSASVLRPLRRVRLTSDGKIRTCLFSAWDHDLHAQMRRGRDRRPNLKISSAA